MLERPPSFSDDQQTETKDQQADSFRDELKSLFGGLGWGLRWLSISLAWGCCLFAFMAMIVYATLGGNITNTGAYYGLTVVLGMMALILTFMIRRV